MTFGVQPGAGKTQIGARALAQAEHADVEIQRRLWIVSNDREVVHADDHGVPPFQTMLWASFIMRRPSASTSTRMHEALALILSASASASAWARSAAPRSALAPFSACAALGLAPALPAATRCRLHRALSVVCGIEPYIVPKDIWGLPGREVKRVALWMANALIDAALRDAGRPAG